MTGPPAWQETVSNVPEQWVNRVDKNDSKKRRQFHNPVDKTEVTSPCRLLRPFSAAARSVQSRTSHQAAKAGVTQTTFSDHSAL